MKERNQHSSVTFSFPLIGLSTLKIIFNFFSFSFHFISSILKEKYFFFRFCNYSILIGETNRRVNYVRLKKKTKSEIHLILPFFFNSRVAQTNFI